MTDAVRSIEQGLKDALANAQGDGVATTQEIDILKRVSGTFAPELACRRPCSRDPSARGSPPACAWRNADALRVEADAFIARDADKPRLAMSTLRSAMPAPR
jgi:hypothetical protein